MDMWASEVGDESYTFKNLLPFYQDGVALNPPNLDVFTNITATPDPPGAFSSNSAGPLQVSYPSVNDPFNSWAQKSFLATGMKNIDGFNSGNLIGSGIMTFTIDPRLAQRSSSQSSFLNMATRNTTLAVYHHTMAQKIIFRGNSATGVRVSTNGSEPYTISARREIIVSAGAFQSPQLLMVSGIGPRDTLNALKIPVLKDLPGVGQNLWDQPFWGISRRVNVPTASTLINNPAVAAAAAQLYQEQHTGPLAISVGAAFGWEKFPDSYRRNFTVATQQALNRFPADWPELEWLPASAYLGVQGNHQISDPNDGYNWATIAASLIAPSSRGNVTIESASMNDPPLINPNWLTDPADIELAVAAFKRQREMWNVLSRYNLTIGSEAYPSPLVQTDAQILAAIRAMVTPIWHAAATCKMGKKTDPFAVIDSDARVYGVQGLRVVDASSFPFLPPGHPQATVYALAQKIASRIMGGARGGGLETMPSSTESHDRRGSLK